MNNEVDVMVTGGTGLIGRWLLAELTRTRNVAAIVRNARARGAELRGFVDRHGGDAGRLTVVEGNVEAPGLGLEHEFANVRDVFHLAARFAFGLGAEEAHRANVGGTLEAARWARARPALRRFVYLGGYRMLAPSVALHHASYPMEEQERARFYRERGGYEASKHESFLALQHFAANSSLRMTGVHPSGVIGDARTGETTQLTGLAELVAQLFEGKLAALPGNERTFVPVVTVDYLARFLASVPERTQTEGQELCVLDPSTPNLHALVGRLAEHLHVRAPRLAVPVGLVKALPRALTGVEPESLTFLSEDRYDTSAAEAHADAVGLKHAPLDESLAHWCDHLVSTRFLSDTGADRGALRDGVYCVGDPQSADVVYLHGLPFNGDAWKPVADRVGARHARVDLPGLGRSAEASPEWLARLLGKRRRAVVLVGHSLGAARAVAFAHAHPEKVAALVLVAPAFLQRPAPLTLRLHPLVRGALRRAPPEELQQRLAPELQGDTHPAFVSACRDLARPGVAARTARALAHASGGSVRERLAEQLRELTIPVTIIYGSEDPLVVADGAAHCIRGAGHNPHLSQPDAVAPIIAAILRSPATASERRTQ